MPKNLIVINNETLERTEVNLSEQYPNSRFYLSNGVVPAKRIEDFAREYLVADKEGRVHTSALYKAFDEFSGGRVHRDPVSKQLKEFLNGIGGVKKVVSIDGVKAQGYSGVRFK